MKSGDDDTVFLAECKTSFETQFLSELDDSSINTKPFPIPSQLLSDSISDNHVQDDQNTFIFPSLKRGLDPEMERAIKRQKARFYRQRKKNRIENMQQENFMLRQENQQLKISMHCLTKDFIALDFQMKMLCDSLMALTQYLKVMEEKLRTLASHVNEEKSSDFLLSFPKLFSPKPVSSSENCSLSPRPDSTFSR